MAETGLGTAYPDPHGPPVRARPSIDGHLIRWLLAALGNPPVEFRLAWSGEGVAPPGTTAVHRVSVADRATLRGLLQDPQVRFADAFTADRIRIDGDLIDFLATLYRSVGSSSGRDSLPGRLAGWLQRPRPNTVAGSRQNIHRHYDLGNDFYSVWLGATMAYTCAYYRHAAATLDEAQYAKMEHICRKLRVGASDTVVEAGCGWGSLALYLAERRGAKVRAFNISREQLNYARDRARERGLATRVEFIEEDYRNIAGSCDVFLSVGMLEHVGVAHYAELGRVIDRTLAAQGRGLIHSIGRNRPGALHPWIERRIFPGAHPPSLSEMTQIFEPSDLSILDVENLRLHYALTLRDWLARYESGIDRVRAQFADEAFLRMWRLYLAGSIAAFETGTLQLFQVLFARHDNNAIPLTREHLYAH